VDGRDRVMCIVERMRGEAFNSASSLANHDCCSVGKSQVVFFCFLLPPKREVATYYVHESPR
jgi:hypothetical protein